MYDISYGVARQRKSETEMHRVAYVSPYVQYILRVWTREIRDRAGGGTAILLLLHRILRHQQLWRIRGIAYFRAAVRLKATFGPALGMTCM